MACIHVTKENFEKEVLQSDKPVIVDFWAQWCGPCRMLAPTVEALAEEREDIKVCKVDVDEERELAIAYGIESIPTLLVFQNGQKTNQSVGVITQQQMENLL